MRLYVGIPTAGAPAKPFLESLARLRVPAGTTAFERGIATGNFVPAQRDLLLERALAWDADVVAMCDDDMILPPDALDTLCGVLNENERAGIAGALYYSRDGLRPMVVDGWDPADNGGGWIPAFDDRTPVAVAGVGFGCVVIRAAAARGFARPFFASQIYVEREAGRVRVCNEDYLFCARLRRAGYDVVLDPRVRCPHYDRATATAAPASWESPEASTVARVLVKTGSRYELVPLAAAPPASTKETRVRADVVYVAG